MQTALLDAPHYGAAKFPPPRPFQETAHQRLRDGARAGHRCQLLMAPTGAGKCLGVDTPVLMADGTIKAVQDVQIGDILLGPDGSPRNVLSVTSGREMLYRVVPKKGMSYVVNASHILSLRKTPGSAAINLANGLRIDDDADVVNVNVEVFAASNKTARHCMKGWRASAIEFPVIQEALLINPYILGAWLGDGCQHMAGLASPECQMVEAWKAEAARRGYEIGVIKSRDGDCPVWRIVSRERNSAGNSFNSLTSALDFYGLRQRKHVPAAYKTAPVADRLQLIAGLIDSDGHLTHSGFDWVSNRHELAVDFAFLCRSVGLAAYVRPCFKGIKSQGFVGSYWRVSVSGDTDRVPCLDKRAPARKQKKRHLVHGIRIEPVGEGDYYGFEIDGDHLFLLGDFTVTHNTYLGMRVIHEALMRGKRAIFVCDRTTLIDQTSRVADSYGLGAHGVIQATHWRRDRALPFQIASVQTLARRNWPHADVIVIDEAHTQYKAWTDYIQSTQAHVVGLSATPFSPGLGRLFTNLVNAATMRDLTESGVLVPMRVFSCTRPDMAGAETSGGEWTDRAAAERGMAIIGDVVAEWSKFAFDRKTIVFGATIAHCEELCRQFNDAGVLAELVTAHTDKVEREQLIAEFSKPDSAIRVLLSVEALAKGFDVKDVGAVCDCRPLRKSLSTAIQMWGRGLRSSEETGKADCLLLDFSGNIVRFAEDFEDVFHNGLDALDMGEKLDKAIRRDEDKPERACPSCGFKPFARRCMACGHEIASQSLIVHEAGQMREVMIGSKKAADDPRHLWEQACTYTKAHGNPETASKRAAHLFREITGNWPPRKWSAEFDLIPNVALTRPLLNKIQSIRIAYAKSLARVA